MSWWCCSVLLMMYTVYGNVSKAIIWLPVWYRTGYRILTGDESSRRKRPGTRFKRNGKFGDSLQDSFYYRRQLSSQPNLRVGSLADRPRWRREAAVLTTIASPDPNGTCMGRETERVADHRPNRPNQPKLADLWFSHAIIDACPSHRRNIVVR